MSRIIRIAAAALAFATATTAFGDDEFDALKADLAEKFPSLEADEIYESPLPGIVEIRQGAMVGYLSIDGRYLFRGDILDLEGDRNLTRDAMAVGRLELLSEFSDEDAVTFAPEETRYTVTVFTDVDCGWCRELHKEIADYNALGISVRYLMWPRGGPGSVAWAKAEQVMCADNRQEALTRAKNDQPLPEADCDTSILRKHFDVGYRMGVNGTPAIVTDTGEFIGGYKPAQALAAILARTPAVSTTR